MIIRADRHARELAEQDEITTDRPASWVARLTLLIGLIGLVLRLWFALLPLSAHLILLEDDAWMVAAIGRNQALGRGITADGVNPTTGFQPLYPLTLGALPYLAAPHALDGGFTASLVICAVLGALATWPLWWLARRLGGPIAGLLAVALYALNPSMIRLTVNAMETALGLLLLLTLFAAYYRLNLSHARGVVALAALSALAILARLDAVLAWVAVGAALFLAAFWPERIAAPGGRRVSWRLALVYLVATPLFLTPYFAFNKLVGGSFGPSSGTALMYMQSYAGSFNLTNGLNAIFQNSAVYAEWLPSLWLKLLLVVVFCGASIGLLGRRLLAALPLLLYLPLPPLYYGYLLQQVRERYFVGFSAVLIILLGWLGAEVLRRVPGRWSAALVGGTAALLIMLNFYEALSFYRTMRDSPELTQPTSYQVALWLRDNLPADALIGAKNSGIYQYYSGHTILNIDGKLNHEIVPAMERRGLLDYLRAKGVGYLVDRETTMADHIMYYSAQFGPAVAHHAPGLTARLKIYGTILLNKLGAHLPLSLDRRDDFVPTRQFSDVAESIQHFPRPNQSTNPVVVYRLLPVGAPGVP